MIYSSNQVNLHTHSFYCGHGIGEISDYVKEAEKSGEIKVLGFSEHCPMPEDNLPDRMLYRQKTDYFSDIEKAQKNTSVVLLKGFECDWRSTHVDYYRSLHSEVDYLIGAVHYAVIDGQYKYIGRIPDFEPYAEEYVNRYTKMLSSGLFLYGCHPDLFLYSMPWNSLAHDISMEIISVAKRCNMPLEINGQGARKKVTDIAGNERMPYPVDNFWKLAVENGVHVCCGSDAHRPDFVYEPKCFEYADKLGIDLVSWEYKDGKINWSEKKV